jgi:hypothetical protein
VIEARRYVGVLSGVAGALRCGTGVLLRRRCPAIAEDDRWGVGSLVLEQGGVGDDSEV